MNSEWRHSRYFSWPRVATLLALTLSHLLPRHVSATSTPDCQPPQIDSTRNLPLTEWTESSNNRFDADSDRGHYVVLYTNAVLWVFLRGDNRWQLAQQLPFHPGDLARMDYTQPEDGDASIYLYACPDEKLAIDTQWRQ